MPFRTENEPPPIRGHVLNGPGRIAFFQGVCGACAAFEWLKKPGFLFGRVIDVLS